jgi:hypothetical protein
MLFSSSTSVKTNVTTTTTTTKEIIEIAIQNYSSASQFVKLSKEKLIELGIDL